MKPWAFILVAVLGLSGCVSQARDKTLPSKTNPIGSPSSTSPTLVKVPFDPCTRYPPDVLQAVGLDPQTAERWDRPGEKRGQLGCIFRNPGYDLSFYAEVLPFRAIRPHEVFNYEPTTIKHRRAATFRMDADPEPNFCDLIVEMPFGIMGFIFAHSSADPALVGDACTITKNTALALEPFWP